MRSVRKLINAETLLIVSLGLCCGMAVLSTKVGFSSAFLSLRYGQHPGRNH